MNRNPLIPMGALTGDFTTEQIHTMICRYAEQGIQQFLMYPRDGCEVPYMSERWLTICGDIIHAAKEYGMTIWLYDEFNWPSGTCFGAVSDDCPEFRAKCIVVKDGKCEIVTTHRSANRPEYYADILNPEVTDLFIEKTHQVYYNRFGDDFGSVIQGIFSDEPAMCYFMSNGSQFPYTKGLENIYRDETGRDLFADVLNPTPDFLETYHTIIGRLFRENFVGRVSDWCEAHHIHLVGHLMNESSALGSLRSSGDAIKALRRFGIPGMDEIFTRVNVDTAEWITLGVAQAAIREVGRGGLCELFALGPTDIPPAKIIQQIWMQAMFGFDHYVLAVSASDARGNLRKNAYYNPMNYMNPWFAGYGELGAAAIEATAFADKTILPEVYVRYPMAAIMRHALDRDKNGHGIDKMNPRILGLLRALTNEQYQWQFLAEDDRTPEVGIVMEVSDSDGWSVENEMTKLKAVLPLSVYVTEKDGTPTQNLLLRRFTDGSTVILDLDDKDETRFLTLHTPDGEFPLALAGRGHYVVGEPLPTVPEVIETVSPSFRLIPDRPNTLRCMFIGGNTEYRFTVAERIPNVRLLLRNYAYDGSISLDGITLPKVGEADALTPGLADLYRSTAPFTLEVGEHIVRASEPVVSEPYLPACFICGHFAADSTDTLSVLPKTVPVGSLATIMPQYAGKITLETSLTLPSVPCRLMFDSSNLYTRVYINGVLSDGQLTGYCYPIPSVWLGRTVTVRIEQYTSIGPVFGRAEEVCASNEGIHWSHFIDWFPGRYEKCGVSDMKFVR